MLLLLGIVMLALQAGRILKILDGLEVLEGLEMVEVLVALTLDGISLLMGLVMGSTIQGSPEPLAMESIC
jgi:hypothetical protein